MLDRLHILQPLAERILADCFGAFAFKRFKEQMRVCDDIVPDIPV